MVFASETRKTIRVLAVPFAPNKFLFYPIPLQEQDFDLKPGRLHRFLRRKYNQYSKAQPGSWTHKFYMYLKKKLDNRDPPDVFLQRLPSSMKEI